LHVHQACLRGERTVKLPSSAAKGKKLLQSRSRGQEIHDWTSRRTISRKARVKAQVRPPTFLSSTFRLFFFSWVIFYCLPQAFFFLSRHSRKLSSTYRKITPSCPGLSRGKSVSHRSYRRILEASYPQRSAQAQPPPPKATLTGVPESRSRQRPAPQQLRLRSDLFILCGNLPSGTDALFR
jgi:hypothetical protein